jgi:glycosyltransferase involved in cell wall biosynthesis
VVGYHGAITELLDWSLLERIIEISGVRLVFIGPVACFDELSDDAQEIRNKVLASEHVTHIQPVPYRDLKYYLKSFNAAIVPFVVNEKTNPVSPLKLYEYMAMGLPIYATPTKTLSRYSNFIRVADREALPELIQKELPTNRNNLAKTDYSIVLNEVDWRGQLAPIVSMLDHKMNQRKSTVRRKKRVDIVNINFYDWDGLTLYKGGAERYVYDLASILKEDGWSPRILQNANNSFELDFRGIPVLGVKTDSGGDVRAMSKKYRDVCRDSDLVIASPADLACEMWGLNVIAINHGIYWDHKYKTLHSTNFAEYKNIFDAITVSSSIVAVDTNFINWLRTYDYNLAGKLTYVPNYFDNKDFIPVAKKFDGPIRILYPRRLYEARGIFITLKAFDYLFARHGEIELHLVGQANTEDQKIVNKFMDRHKGRVIWEEFDMEEMHKVYRTSHITLVPTMYSEGTSLSCLEAMATNNAIVATNVGGLPNLVVDGFNGLLISPTSEAIIQALEFVLADRKMMGEMAARGVELASVFEKNKWSRRWRNVVTGIFK